MSELIETEVTKKLTSAISRTLGSGVEELSQAIADRIRFFRWKSAVRTLEKAREFAEPRGGLENLPPLKFFLPFMENCSLEDSDETVIDMWANLLVSAAMDFEPGHLLFMRILREITGSEARLLADVATSKRDAPRPTRSQLTDATAEWEMFSARASPLQALDLDRNWPDVKQFVFEQLQKFGVAIEHLALLEIREHRRVEVECIESNDTVLAGHSRISLDILVSLNLVEKVVQEFEDQNHILEGVAYCLTAMGAAFYTACTEPQLANS